MYNTGFFMRLSVDDLIREFEDFGRGNQFSSAALAALHDYYEDYSDSLGEPVFLDVIGICCEWSELTIEEALMDYGYDDLDELEENTTVVRIDHPDGDRVLVATH